MRRSDSEQRLESWSDAVGETVGYKPELQAQLSECSATLGTKGNISHARELTTYMTKDEALCSDRLCICST